MRCKRDRRITSRSTDSEDLRPREQTTGPNKRGDRRQAGPPTSNVFNALSSHNKYLAVFIGVILELFSMGLVGRERLVKRQDL